MDTNGFEIELLKGEFLDSEWYEFELANLRADLLVARAGIRAIQKAKGTPITAEALKAAGWVESGRPTIRRDGVVIYRNNACFGIAAGAMFVDGQIIGDFEIKAAGFKFHNVTSMYDLTELVRLLGTE